MKSKLLEKLAIQIMVVLVGIGGFWAGMYYSMEKLSQEIEKWSSEYEQVSRNLSQYMEMTSDGLPEGGDTQAVLESRKLAEEIVDNKEEKYIFESPDGGKTVFKRKFGSDKRELIEDWKTISE